MLEFQLNTYLSLYRTLCQHITELEELMIFEFSNVSSQLQSIPGIGLISAASIYSEVEDFDRFNHPDQLVAFCGLDPAYYQSGQSEYTGRMVKRGSPYLRQYIMNCSIYVMMYNSTFYEYYHKKRNEGKAHRVALSHVAKKLIRIIFKLEKDSISFDSTKMR